METEQKERDLSLPPADKLLFLKQGKLQLRKI